MRMGSKAFMTEKLAVRGFAEVVKRLPEILRIRRGSARVSASAPMCLWALMHPILIWAWPKS